VTLRRGREAQSSPPRSRAAWGEAGRITKGAEESLLRSGEPVPFLLKGEKEMDWSALGGGLGVLGGGGGGGGGVWGGFRRSPGSGEGDSKRDRKGKKLFALLCNSERKKKFIAEDGKEDP